MGGIIHLSKAAKIYRGGKEVAKLYHGGEEIWRKPIKSVFSNPGIGRADNVLIVGSSDVAGLTHQCWNLAGFHNWLDVFRDDYNGSFFGSINGVTVPGYGAAITLGRVTCYEIMNRAEDGQYPEEYDPLLSMGNYDALIIDTFDERFNFPHYATPYPDGWEQINTPQPYFFMQNGSQQTLSEELSAQMTLTRLAVGNGLKRLYITSPWPRLKSSTDASTDAAWRSTFAAAEKFAHYMQDRLNYQMEQETLAGQYNMIPFHAMIARIYDDIQAGTAPETLTDIRMIFANQDQTGDATDPTIAKHQYMLNHIGAYALNCLTDRVVHAHDPRGKPNTDGRWTVPTDIATYLQNLGVEIGDTYSRTGRSRKNVGYVMHPISNGTPEEIIGSTNLLVASEETISNGTTLDFIRPGVINHFFAVFGFDPAATEPLDSVLSIFNAWGSTSTRRTSLRAVRFGGSPTISMLFDNENSGSYSMASFSNPQFTENGRFYAVEGYQGTNAFYDQYGQNMAVSAIDMTRPIIGNEYHSNNRMSGTAHRTNAVLPVVNRIHVPTSSSTLGYFVAADRILSEGERYNIWRHISRKFQCDAWDLFTPDMVNEAA